MKSWMNFIVCYVFDLIVDRIECGLVDFMTEELCFFSLCHNLPAADSIPLCTDSYVDSPQKGSTFMSLDESRLISEGIHDYTF